MASTSISSWVSVGLGRVIGVVAPVSALSVVGSIVHRRFDSGLGEVASLGAQPRLVENIIDAALFLDGQGFEDGSACLSFGRDLVGASAIEAAHVQFGRGVE